MCLYDPVTVEESPLRGGGSVAADAPDDSGAIDAKPEASLTDFRWKSYCVAEGLPGPNGLRVVDM